MSATVDNEDGTSYFPSTAEKLKLLGDPSGQQNAKYWDEWFDIVCKEQNHQPFEWYTGVKEVSRILKHHISNGEGDNNAKELGMVHPGSGTSLLPLKLQNDFPHHHQIVVDISELALDEMRQIHEARHYESCPTSAATKKRIEYLVADILNPPMGAVKDSSCEAWIDKGFIDAVFCSPEKGADQAEQDEQARKLFVETNRVLSQGGVSLIVTLAEDHSLQMIINNWINFNDGDNNWHPCLHVWEMIPVSGTLRPFGVVLTKSSQSMNSSRRKSLIFHRRIDNVEEEILLPTNGTDGVFQAFKEQVQEARANFEQEMKRQSSPREPASLDNEKQQTVLATLELKPCEAVGRGDLEALEAVIRSRRWQRTGGVQSLLRPKWHPFTEEGQEPTFANIVPIGFGISKLLMRCVIASDDLDDLVMEIEEWGETEEANQYGGIGSVDIESAVPVGDAMDLFSKNRKT